MNYYSDEQIAWLARGVSVVYCPRAAAYFGHVGHRWREMLAAGVNVCLGTDGRGCTPSLSLLDELLALRRGTGIEAADSARLLRMATLAGANALGVEAECGSIETGKSADLISLDGVTVADGGAIRMSDATQIREVWLRGERLVHNGICASLE
ncbi:MAG: amidohydrolase family protein [Phycisphaerae bacterium]